MDKTSLGDRIKEYEAIYDVSIMKRVPVVVRLDGKSFSRLTKRLKLDKPFDVRFLTAMADTMVSVASKVQGCVVGYTQSDEISLVLINYRSLDAEPYFGNRVLKIASITASMATAHFNRRLVQLMPNSLVSSFVDHEDAEAYFDSRPFAVPTAVEAMNALIWRQQDCVRNSILSAAYYEIGKVKGRKTTQKMMHGLDTSKLQELLFHEVGINWSTHYSPELKRGTVTYRKLIEVETPNGKAVRHKWVTEGAPVFQSEEGQRWLLSLLDVVPGKPEDADVV
jgi:tRNA(His) 5'-end guanylyltransferase